jgi:transposase
LFKRFSFNARQSVNAVVKSEKHPEVRNRYLHLKKCRRHKKAIIAIARMLLSALSNMLKKKEAYNADLHKKSNVLPVDREITVEQAISLAQFHGYRVKTAI